MSCKCNPSYFIVFIFLGVNFDFFGIGEFWGCKSVHNDFGLQFRFYYYERASLIGGVALKAGRSVVTIMTIKTENVQDSPIVRYEFPKYDLTLVTKTVPSNTSSSSVGKRI